MRVIIIKRLRPTNADLKPNKSFQHYLTGEMMKLNV